MGRYRDVTVGGTTFRKHIRDIDKDNAIRAMLPEGRLRIFEASCGGGQLARELQLEGHELVVSNFILKNFEDLDEREVDLNRDIEFADGTFDVVICKEVIEHVESVPHVLRQFGKCLKPGGTLILTFPNRLQMRSRFYHLFTGFYRGMRSPINLDVPFGEAHINLIGFPEMDYFLRKCGFGTEVVTTSYTQWADSLFKVFRPLMRLAGDYYLLRHKKNAEEHEKTKAENRAYNTFILEHLLGDPLYVGKGVIMSARKGAEDNYLNG